MTQYGHAGQHHGTGRPGCPRELHHHHDDRCEPPRTAREVRELVEHSRREAWSEHGGHVEVMHGSRCVGLVLHDEDGAAVGGLVLSPDVARHLAVVLIEQAASSERPEPDSG